MTHRKEAQALMCASIIDGKERGSKLKHDGADVRMRVQETLFNRRRDKKLTNIKEKHESTKPCTKSTLATGEAGNV